MPKVAFAQYVSIAGFLKDYSKYSIISQENSYVQFKNYVIQKLRRHENAKF